jgi:hypothetical protein
MPAVYVNTTWFNPGVAAETVGAPGPATGIAVAAADAALVPAAFVALR